MNVYKIGAVWCSGCLVMKPRWREIEQELPWLKTMYYDFDEDQEKIASYGISTDRLPVCIFFDKEGKEFHRMSGEVDKATLVAFCKQHKDR